MINARGSGWFLSEGLPCRRACVDFGNFGAEGRGVDFAVHCNFLLPRPSQGHSLSAERMCNSPHCSRH
ncbi:hypothetical protein B0H12DRAFT_1143725, partial [Mycena haematopus]